MTDWLIWTWVAAIWLFLDPFLCGQLTWRTAAGEEPAPTPDEGAIEP